MSANQGLGHDELARRRLLELIDQLSSRGLSQTEIASRANLPGQYLSDVKLGRRPMTELLARRLADEFDVDHRWLLGLKDSMQRPRIAAWLPAFDHPIQGDPKEQPKWNGIGIEVAGAALAQLADAVQPYVLVFGHDDVEGRMCRGDFVLISQAPKPAAAISVVRYRNKAFLARSEPR